ncbi:MAG TPA: glycosyltransferase family 39 protein [Polyangiaceae bacterium]|nr:glycosyltransferase family 39 protein [Polyangiaceae bacterium]
MNSAGERGLERSLAGDTNLLTRDVAFTLAVFLTALLPRLFVAIAWAKEPVWDGHYYHFGAERIARGLGYSEDVLSHGRLLWKPWVHYPVGYSAVLGFFYRIFGSELVVAPVVNALTGALLVAVVHRLARYYVSRDRARIAASLSALHPGLIAYSAVVMTEPLAALLLLGAGWCALHFRGRWQAIVFSGALLGVATLVRPASLLGAPLLIFTQPKPWWQAALRAAGASAIALVVVLPWTLRNCQRLDGCTLVSTNGGWNLAIGAITQTGRFQTLRAADGCPIVTGQVQQDRCWAEVGRAKIAADPGGWLGKAPLKLAQTFDHESFAIEYLHEADPNSWPEPRRVAARELLTAFHRLLLVLAALSVVQWQRFQVQARSLFFTQLGLGVCVLGIAAYAALSDAHPFYLLAVLTPLLSVLPLPGRPAHGAAGGYLLSLLAITALTHVVFFGEDRYHLVVTPLLCVLAAAAFRTQGTVTGPSLSASAR